MRRYLFLVFIVSGILAPGCKNDSKLDLEVILDGNWVIDEAFRNNELTKTLDNGYFRFKNDSMETNIIGKPVSGGVEIIGNTFVHESELPVTYSIAYYNEDTLHLLAQIQSFNFLFKLSKETSESVE